ncbi:MAG: sigma factor-like helix-turn-helix DNA-binding protein, partial [Huintestinicola sp.]
VTLEDTGFSLENESVSEESIIDKKEKILGDLSDSEKKLYKMIYIDNLKQRDVAEKLGISLKAVSVRSFRLREKIKKLTEAAFSAILMLFMNFAF